MSDPEKIRFKHWFNVLVILFVLVFIILVDGEARRVRRTTSPNGGTLIYHVASQKDVYGVYARLGLHGAKVVHMNRHMNFVDYFPKEEARSAPFPLHVADSRPAYEKGIDSHNWLFIANRTGKVRAVSSVLPDEDFNNISAQLSSDFSFRFLNGFFDGYTYDIPWTISTLNTLPVIDEPVVVNIDAGYFMRGTDPVKTASLLRSKCPDVRVIVLISSIDETDTMTTAIDALKVFEAAWKGR